MQNRITKLVRLVSMYLLLSVDETIVVRECEREGIGITDGNGNKIRLKLEVGINHWEREEMGLKKAFPPIYVSQSSSL